MERSDRPWNIDNSVERKLQTTDTTTTVQKRFPQKKFEDGV